MRFSKAKWLEDAKQRELGHDYIKNCKDWLNLCDDKEVEECGRFYSYTTKDGLTFSFVKEWLEE